MKEIIYTDKAPAAIGPYSQAIKVDRTVYLSGQIPLDPLTMQMITSGIQEEAVQVIKNLQAVCQAAGGQLNQIVKLTIFLTDLANFAVVNDVMTSFFTAPYPARSTVQVSALPKNAAVEIEAVMII